MAQDIEPRARVVRRTTAVSATNGLNDVLRKRPAIGDRRARDPKELTQGRGVRVEAMGQALVAHALKALQLGIVGDQVEKRWLNQRQRPHLFRRAGGRDQRTKRAVGVGDDMGTSIEQWREIGGVEIEVLAPIRGRWTGREAASVGSDQPPAI